MKKLFQFCLILFLYCGINFAQTYDCNNLNTIDVTGWTTQEDRAIQRLAILKTFVNTCPQDENYYDKFQEATALIFKDWYYGIPGGGGVKQIIEQALIDPETFLDGATQQLNNWYTQLNFGDMILFSPSEYIVGPSNCTSSSSNIANTLNEVAECAAEQIYQAFKLAMTNSNTECENSGTSSDAAAFSLLDKAASLYLNINVVLWEDIINLEELWELKTCGIRAIKIDAAQNYIIKGNTIELHLEALDGTNNVINNYLNPQNIEWQNLSSIVQISGDGIVISVTGVDVGTATIRARYINLGKVLETEISLNVKLECEELESSFNTANANCIAETNLSEKKVLLKYALELQKQMDLLGCPDVTPYECICGNIFDLNATNIDIKPRDTTIVVGSVIQLTPKIINDQRELEGDVLWISLTPNIATVNENGVVKAVSEGVAKIEAISSDIPEIVGFTNISITKPSISGGGSSYGNIGRYDPYNVYDFKLYDGWTILNNHNYGSYHSLDQHSFACYFGAGGGLLVSNGYLTKTWCYSGYVCQQVINMYYSFGLNWPVLILRKDGNPVDRNVIIPLKIDYIFQISIDTLSGGEYSGSAGGKAVVNLEIYPYPRTGTYYFFDKMYDSYVNITPYFNYKPMDGSGTLNIQVPGYQAYFRMDMKITVYAQIHYGYASVEVRAIADPYVYIDASWPQADDYVVMTIENVNSNNWVPYENNMFLGEKKGDITGIITVNNEPISSIIIDLTNQEGNIIAEGVSDEDGNYNFADVAEGNYNVSIIEPLGYDACNNPISTTVTANQTSTVDFCLNKTITENNARGQGYWKHQFNVAVKGKGNPQENSDDLCNYIDLIHKHYTPHYNIFENILTFEDWLEVLEPPKKKTKLDEAKKHFAATLFNLVSDKIGQYTIVTKDNRTVGDVIDYISQLILDGDEKNDELAKDLAEKVNEQHKINEGTVPVGSTLFKLLLEAKEITSYKLFNNFPNPFNAITKIQYQIPYAENVKLRVYDMLGKEIELLIDEMKEPGSYEFSFDGSNLSSGVYYYRFQAGSYVATKKMILMK